MDLVKAKDESRTVLASVSYEWESNTAYSVSVCVEGESISGFIAEKKILEASDGEYAGGGIGAIVVDGSAAIDRFDIASLKRTPKVEEDYTFFLYRSSKTAA